MSSNNGRVVISILVLILLALAGWVITLPPNSVEVYLEAYGIVISGQPKKYVIIEPMGGVAKMYGREYLKENQGKEIPFTFNVSNSSDYPRRIFINTVQTVSPAWKNIRLTIDQPRDFDNGQTQVVNGTVAVGGIAPFPIPIPIDKFPWWVWVIVILVLIVLSLLLRQRQRSRS